MRWATNRGKMATYWAWWPKHCGKCQDRFWMERFVGMKADGYWKYVYCTPCYTVAHLEKSAKMLAYEDFIGGAVEYPKQGFQSVGTPPSGKTVISYGTTSTNTDPKSCG